MSTTVQGNTFWQDTVIYASRIKLFTPRDWTIYILWVGQIFGLFLVTLGFLLVGHSNGVVYPAYVWNIPIGVFIFATAIAFDSIGHRTIYFDYLQKGEALVHGVTIFCGIISILLLCLGYHWPVFMTAPAIVMVALSVVYSVIDEAMHWFRYFSQESDRVEMWSHVGIFVGHNIMVVAWVWWFWEGYPGVSETLPFIPGL